ncbi:MAG: ferrous iron transport protein A [Planctomycetes bacterium]|nr:ferrous iron transport protein A [Planctomycetota bacterium]
MSTAFDLVPLHMAPAGRTAEVAQLLGLPPDVHRLEELGLRIGAQVEIVQSGSPCIVRLAGHKLCFRDSELFRVLVRVEDRP